MRARALKECASASAEKCASKGVVKCASDGAKGVKECASDGVQKCTSENADSGSADGGCFIGNDGIVHFELVSKALTARESMLFGMFALYIYMHLCHGTLPWSLLVQYYRPRTPHKQNNAPSGHTGEQEPSGPGRRRRNTTHLAGTPVNRDEVAQDTAAAEQRTDAAQR